MSEFIVSKGSTVEQFYEKMKDAFEEDEDGDRATFGKIIMATTDFDVFMQLMKDTAEDMPASEGKSSNAGK